MAGSVVITRQEESAPPPPVWWDAASVRPPLVVARAWVDVARAGAAPHAELYLWHITVQDGEFDVIRLPSAEPEAMRCRRPWAVLHSTLAAKVACAPPLRDLQAHVGLHCLTEAGLSVFVDISGWRPWFSVRLPDGWGARECAALEDWLRAPPKNMPHMPPMEEGLVSVIPQRRSDIMPYLPDPVAPHRRRVFDSARISCASLRVAGILRRRLEFADVSVCGGAPVRLAVRDVQQTDYCKFIIDTGITFSWFKLTLAAAAINDVDRAVRWTTCQIEASAPFTALVPATGELVDRPPPEPVDVCLDGEMQAMRSPDGKRRMTNAMRGDFSNYWGLCVGMRGATAPEHFVRIVLALGDVPGVTGAGMLPVDAQGNVLPPASASAVACVGDTAVGASSQLINVGLPAEALHGPQTAAPAAIFVQVCATDIELAEALADARMRIDADMETTWNGDNFDYIFWRRALQQLVSPPHLRGSEVAQVAVRAKLAQLLGRRNALPKAETLWRREFKPVPALVLAAARPHVGTAGFAAAIGLELRPPWLRALVKVIEDIVGIRDTAFVLKAATVQESIEAAASKPKGRDGHAATSMVGAKRTAAAAGLLPASATSEHVPAARETELPWSWPAELLEVYNSRPEVALYEVDAAQLRVALRRHANLPAEPRPAPLHTLLAALTPTEREELWVWIAQTVGEGTVRLLQLPQSPPGTRAWWGGRLLGRPDTSLKDVRMNTGARGNQWYTFAVLEGRVPVDLMTVTKDDLSLGLRENGLEKVAPLILAHSFPHLGKLHMPKDKMFIMYEGELQPQEGNTGTAPGCTSRGAPPGFVRVFPERAKIVAYAGMDILLPSLILRDRKYPAQWMQVAALTRTPVFAIRKGGAMALTSNQIAVNNADWAMMTGGGESDWPRGVPIKGALVLHAREGFYKYPVATFDFASLYPSIMTQDNLCFSTELRAADRPLVVRDPLAMVQFVDVVCSRAKVTPWQASEDAADDRMRRLVADEPEPETDEERPADADSDVASADVPQVATQVATQVGTQVAPQEQPLAARAAALVFAKEWNKIGLPDGLPRVLVEGSDDRALYEWVGTSPSGKFRAAFMQNEPSVLSRNLEAALTARKAAKAAMKATRDPHMKAVLDARQGALKIIANSMYGFTAAALSPNACLPAGAATTHYARCFLRAVMRFIHTRNPEALIVYGDTDSVMVLPASGWTPEQTQEWAVKTCFDITRAFVTGTMPGIDFGAPVWAAVSAGWKARLAAGAGGGPADALFSALTQHRGVLRDFGYACNIVSIVPEKILWYAYFNKGCKCYFFRMMVPAGATPGVWTITTEEKGQACARKNPPPLVTDLGSAVCKEVVVPDPVDAAEMAAGRARPAVLRAKAMVLAKAQAILDNTLPLEEFTITMGLGMDYKAEPMHARVVRQMRERGDTNIPSEGSRVALVVIEPPKDAKAAKLGVGDHVEHVDYVRAAGLRPDAVYYLEQLRKSLETPFRSIDLPWLHRVFGWADTQARQAAAFSRGTKNIGSITRAWGLTTPRPRTFLTLAEQDARWEQAASAITVTPIANGPLLYKDVHDAVDDLDAADPKPSQQQTPQYSANANAARTGKGVRPAGLLAFFARKAGS